MLETENCKTKEQTGAAQNQGQTGAARAEEQCASLEDGQTGAAENLSPAQKMENLLREGRPQYLKKQIEKLRQEASKNRVAAAEALEAKTELEAKAKQIQTELAELKKAHRAEVIMRKLDARGCLKSSLAVKDVPEDCEDLDKFIETYCNENPFLFNKNKTRHGGLFKPQKTRILSPSQQMDRVIRSALGR